MTRKEAILQELGNDDEKLVHMLALYSRYKDMVEKTKDEEDYKDIIEEKIKMLNEEIGGTEDVSN